MYRLMLPKTFILLLFFFLLQEIALIHGGVRTASIICKTTCEFLVVMKEVQRVIKNWGTISFLSIDRDGGIAFVYFSGFWRDNQRTITETKRATCRILQVRDRKRNQSLNYWWNNAYTELYVYLVFSGPWCYSRIFLATKLFYTTPASFSTNTLSGYYVTFVLPITVYWSSVWKQHSFWFSYFHFSADPMTSSSKTVEKANTS